MRLTKQQTTFSVKQANTFKYLVLGLIIYMPFHLFIAQWFSTFTGGISVYKIAKDLVIIAGSVYALFILYRYARTERWLWLNKILYLSLAYLALHLVYLLVLDLDMESALLATIYNNRLFGLLLIGLAAGVVINDSEFKALTVGWMLLTAFIVTIFGLAQVVLPPDFMSNFGYSFDRGAREYFSIDSKPGLTRIFSTVRDPNSLGAYLMVVFSVGFSLLLSKTKDRENLASLLILIVGAIGFTFSRSSWLALVTVMLIIVIQTGLYKQFLNKKVIVSVSLLLAVLASLTFVFRDNYFIENILWHADENTTEIGSTEKHFLYKSDSIERTIEEPLGYGPGTAGIVSIRNPDTTTLNENYYLQIAHEVGVVGLALFVWLNVEVYRALLRSERDYLRLGLIASFWGLVITNMLLHTWSNEVVATTWWLLAGLHIGVSYSKKQG